MRFKIILISVFTLIYFYLLTSLWIPIQEPLWVWSGGVFQAFMFGTILWVPLYFWNLDIEQTPLWQLLVLGAAFCFMGLISFAFVFCLMRDTASMLLPVNLKTPNSSYSILGISLICFSVGAFLAHYGVRIKTVYVPFQNLPKPLVGIKILQISDLHVGPTIRGPFVKKIVQLVQSTQPDLVAFTGDAIDGTVEDLASLVAPLKEITSRYGNFYVTGNHEHYWDAPGWSKHFGSLGFEPLQNEHRVVQVGDYRIAVAGVPDPAAAMNNHEGPDFKKTRSQIPEDAYPKILLCHQPKFAKQAAEVGFDLQLSGHTHGGQFFPWTLIARLVHRYHLGLHRLNQLWVYVSPGTGYWGPPVRIGSPAEVTLLVLKRG